MKPPKRLFKNRPSGEVPDKIRSVVGMLVQFTRELDGITDPEAIRGRILEYAGAAFEEATEVTTEMRRFEPGVMEECATLPVMAVLLFRAACDEQGYDWRDPHQQETAFARIERTLADVLANGY
jgi:hypothetical protein